MGAAASFIQSEDEAALLELLNAPAAAGLGLVRIAPTVRRLARRAPGNRPGPPGPGARPGRWRKPPPASSGCAAAPRRPAAAGRSTPPRGTAPPEADIDAQLAVLRANGSRPRRRRRPPAGGRRGSEEATQLGLETLQKAIRLKQRVVMNVVDSMGNASRETVVPVAVNGGRVRVFDPDKETERVLSIHRIIDVEATEELLQ